MVKMKAYTKTIYRSIKSNLGRIISIVFIILIGITCYSGLGTLTTEVKSSFNNYYNESFLSDLNVKTTSETGFSEEEILKFENDETIDEVDAFTSLEFDNYEDNTRLYIFNKDDHDLNKLEIVFQILVFNFISFRVFIHIRPPQRIQSVFIDDRFFYLAAIIQKDIFFFTYMRILNLLIQFNVMSKKLRKKCIK